MRPFGDWEPFHSAGEQAVLFRRLNRIKVYVIIMNDNMHLPLLIWGILLPGPPSHTHD